MTDENRYTANKILDRWAQNLTAPAISEISGVPRKRVLRIVQTARTDNDLLKFTRHKPGIKPKDANNV